MIVGTGLEWVLDEVDAAIAAGVPEEKVLRRRQQQVGGSAGRAAEATKYEVVDRALASAEPGTSGRGATLVIATRAMTDQERVRVLLEALRRVLVELPYIEIETLKTLRTVPESDEGSRSEVEGVVFEPEETPRPRRRTSIILGDRLPDARRQRLDTLFAAATREVERDR
ncbi:hypothetical protein AWN90_18715 [Nocardia terpenica]|uniref:Uncharacterized protein n=1 Tax=Nocardia terpenica TaxID=455432 RepID=A0A164PD98_9NOCA|nr:hypothetical protein AWN90_18715 [Nocardia terpenica]